MSRNLQIESLLDKKICDLTIDQKQLISLIEAFITNPAIIIFDSTNCQINNYYKNKVLNELKKINSSIIHITNDIEDALISDELILIKEGKLIVQDTFENILNDITSVPIEKTFIFKLSERLKLYEIVDKTYYKKNELVNDIWK